MLEKRLRCFVVGACDLATGEPTPSTLSTLIHSLVGSNHLVAAGLHALSLDTHRCGVRATGRPVNHLQGHKKSLLILFFKKRLGNSQILLHLTDFVMIAWF